jgi:hypothetical protein
MVAQMTLLLPQHLELQILAAAVVVVQVMVETVAQELPQQLQDLQ